MPISFKFSEYDGHSNDENVVMDNAEINNNSEIEISYDGGRLSVFVDGKEYKNPLAGNDFNLTIKNKV